MDGKSAQVSRKAELMQTNIPSFKETGINKWNQFISGAKFIATSASLWILVF